MRKLLIITLYMLSLFAIACTNSADLDIKQDYEFEVHHLPVPKSIKNGETVEIRLQLVRTGHWEGAGYFMRYFQPDGTGELKKEDGLIFEPNDLYEITKETFRLYYTSQSEDQQVIDLYFLDNFENMVILSFSFNNVSTEEEK